MGKKILIIDDQADQYFKIQKWIVNDLRFKEENVIPNTKADIEEMVIASKSDDDIKSFVEKQIRTHYKDLVLILCDLRFIEDNDGGNKIVEHIRQLEGFSPSNWATLVPIIGMTSFVTSGAKIKDIIKAGADYGFEKAIVTENQTKPTEDKEILKAIISTKIRKFKKNTDAIYPLEIKDKIISFKNKYKDKKTAFIMIDFRHLETAKEIRRVLLANDIYGFYANAPGGKNDEETWKNIQIFMHGCDFGISVFADDSKPTSDSKKKRNKINPNVCIEVGYMRGLQKEVLYLKDNSLVKNDLPSDFHGKLYTEFDNELSLEVKLTELLINRGLIEKK